MKQDTEEIVALSLRPDIRCCGAIQIPKALAGWTVVVAAEAAALR